MQYSRKIVQKFVLIVAASITFFYQESFAFEDDDFQYWNTENVSWKVSDDWKGSFEVEFRYGDNASNFYYQHSDLGFTYSGFGEWLDLGFNYRQIFEEKSSVWRDGCVPHFNATVKGKLFDMPVSNRSRFEYNEIEEADDYWRYRNKASVKFPIKLTKLEIQPYLSDEIFYDFDAGSLNKNRFYSGFTLKLLNNLKADIFYLLQRNKNNGKWTDVNALGTKLILSF
ncbi:MAG: DUF2490 domain-containing protein [Candidatus Omnitrophota bacterium]